MKDCCSYYPDCKGCNEDCKGNVGAKDNINHPDHYTQGGIETIDFIEAKKLNYHRANAIKYITRAGIKNKDTEVEDLQKAVWYLQRDIERIKHPVRTVENGNITYKLRG